MNEQENVLFMILLSSCGNHSLDFWHSHHLTDSSQNHIINLMEEINWFEVLPIIALITSRTEDKVIFSSLLFGWSHFKMHTPCAFLWKHDFFLTKFLNISMTVVQCLNCPFTFQKYKITANFISMFLCNIFNYSWHSHCFQYKKKKSH